MADSITITFLGAGNLAWHLAPALDNCGYVVDRVYNRNARSAEALVQRLYNAEVAADLDFSESESHCFFFCVADDAIEQIATEIKMPPHAVAVHCSGSTSVEVLKHCRAAATGVLYPLQTFSKSRRMDFGGVPLLVESDHSATRSMLMGMAKTLSGKAYKVGEAKRFAVHLAAVFACNFANRLFKEAEDILHECGHSLDLLAPLISETLSKAMELGPYIAQTGPARRGDLHILDRQLDYLSGGPSADLYRLLSQHILDDYPDQEEA